MTRNQKIKLLKELKAGNKSAASKLIPDTVKVYMATHQSEYTMNGKPISKEKHDKGVANAIIVDFTLAM